MLTDLNDLLSSGEDVELNDLVAQVNVADTPINNGATANNMASHASLLGDSTQVIDSYRKMSDEFKTNEGSQTYNDVVSKASADDAAMTYEEMANMMGDDTVPLGDRTALFNEWSINSPIKVKDAHELVQQQQLSNDGAIVDDHQVEQSRLSIAQHLTQVNEYNKNIQKMLNATQLANDVGTAGTLANILDLILPLKEGADVGATLAAVEGNQDVSVDRTKNIFTGIAAMGESKEYIRRKISALPTAKRMELAQNVHDLVVSGNSTIVGGKNELEMMNHLRDYLVEGEYSTADRVIDDITGLLDAVGIGAGIRATVKGLTSSAKTAAVMGRSPRALTETVGAVNTRSANEMMKVIIEDETGEMAKSIANSSRSDAVVNGMGGEVGKADGSVRYKPLIEDKEFSPDYAAIDKVTDPNGSIQFSRAEKNDKIAQVNTDFRTDDKTGLVHHPEMTTIRETDRGVEVRTVYSPAEGGWLNGSDAYDQVKIASRKYGVKEEDLTLLRRDANGNYLPVPKEEFTDLRQAIPANHTRMYHGGLPARSALELNYTPNKAMALEEAKRTGGSLYYVDVPNARAELKAVSAIDGGNPANGVMLPADLSANRKLVPDEMPEGNYAVGVNFTSAYDPADTIAMSVTDAKFNFLGVPIPNIFDRVPVLRGFKSGSVTQHLIPPTSYIDPLLTRSASVAVDRTNYARHALFNVAGVWADRYKKLSKTDKSALDAYILEANHKSLKFNPMELRNRGFSEDQMDALRSWKQTQDTLYVLENVDLARQTRRAGYKLLEAGDTKQVVKEINLSTASKLKITQAFDPAEGKLVAVADRKKIYDDGGTIATFRTPMDMGDDVHAQYVIVRQQPGNYTRAIRDNDKLLNYRDGHFTIYYKDPVFITTEAKTVDGDKFTQVIATAPNIKDAQKYAEQMRASNPEKTYNIRGDVKTAEREDMEWNQKVHTGRTAQRQRGEMLQDVTDRPIDLEFRHIVSPEESVMRSINSISRRIDMKEWLDTAKKRFMQQYVDYLPRHPETHTPMMPRDVKDLVKPDISGDMADFTDALSTFRYIDQMENGFVNLLDEASKSFFKTMADTAGKKGWSHLETALRAADKVGPSTWARKQAFRLTLAANPQRQVIVQASQALPTILATNPLYVTKVIPHLFLTRFVDMGGASEVFMKAVGRQFGMTEKEVKTLVDAYENSGISSAVTAHSQIRDDMMRLVNRGTYQQVQALVRKPLDIMQKIGFEAGENILMRSMWLSEYDLLRKSGKTINAESLAQLHARVRDLTWNMNKAGEMAYNENMFSTVMQFAQAQHKAMSLVFFGNRSLSEADRIKLGTLYVATFGTGYGLAYDEISKLLPPDDRKLHDAVSGGFFNLAMNKLTNTIFGGDSNVDYSSSLRPFEIPNLFKMWTNMGEASWQEAITKSPSMSLFVGDNARVGNLFKALNRWYEVPEDDGALTDVGMTFGNMFSGVSNTFKAIYALKRGYTTSAKGAVADPSVDETEALMQFFGFKTVDEMLSFAFNESAYKVGAEFKKDVKYLVDEVSRRLSREGISDSEVDYVIRIYQEANRVFDNDPQAMAVVQSELERRGGSGDYLIFNRLMQAIPMTTESEFFDLLNKAPLDPDKKNSLVKAYHLMKDSE